MPMPFLTFFAAEAARQRELRETYARTAARRDLLYARVAEARDKLLAVQVGG